MAANKKRKRAAPRRPTKRVRRRPQKVTKAADTGTAPSAITPRQPATPRRRIHGGALLNASPLNTSMFNQPPAYIEGVAAKGEAGDLAQTPLPLAESARANVAAEAHPPPRPPSQPDPSHWDNSSSADAAAQIAATPRGLSAAVLSTTGSNMLAMGLPTRNSNATIGPPQQIPEQPRPFLGSSMAAFSGRAELTLTPGAGAADARALHAEMLERIEALEKALVSRRQRRRRGIGHNNPPEPIEPEPLSANELREIRRAMAVLKVQPPAPSAPSAETRAAVTLLTKLGDRLRFLAIAAGAYLGKQADNFITEAVKESGRRIVQSPFWLAIISQLPALADVAHRWLESLGLH